MKPFCWDVRKRLEDQVVLDSQLPSDETISKIAHQPIHILGCSLGIRPSAAKVWWHDVHAWRRLRLRGAAPDSRGPCILDGIGPALTGPVGRVCYDDRKERGVRSPSWQVHNSCPHSHRINQGGNSLVRWCLCIFSIVHGTLLPLQAPPLPCIVK